jgi:hypothetical protein
MSVASARGQGRSIATLLGEGRASEAFTVLQPLVSAPTSFRILDTVGGIAGTAPSPAVDAWLETIATHPTEGGWVVIGSALRQRISQDLPGAFARCQRFAIAGNAWYAADILAERVPGPALVDLFDDALEGLEPWRSNPDRWVRRMVGVAIHFWAKRSGGALGLATQAARLLEFLGPTFEERDLDAAKGIGWGLKTLGRSYPDLVTDWLVWQRGRPHRAVIRRKALSYLPAEDRRRVTGDQA